MTPDLPFYVFPNSVLNISIVQLWTDLKGLDFAAVENSLKEQSLFS